MNDTTARSVPSCTLAIIIALTVSACSTFDIETPDNMVAVEKSKREYVAMTHDGVVLRALVHEQGEGDSSEVGRASLDFWVESVGERMRTRGGYALLDQSKITSANGVEGAQLQFGRDQDGDSYLYVITLFVTDKNVHVLDAGGEKERFEAVQSSVDAAIRTYEVRK